MMSGPTDEERIAFSTKVEELAILLNISHWDALVDFCNKNDCEVEVAALLLTPSLVDKISDELNDLNLLKTKYTKIVGL